MAISPAITKSFKLECWQSIHNLSSDTLMIALFDNAATLNSDTTVYSATNEVVGTGYTQGGIKLTGSTGFPKIDTASGQIHMRHEAATWLNATFTARGALIYNASKANRAIAVIDFGNNVTTVTNGPFVVGFPVASPPILINA